MALNVGRNIQDFAQELVRQAQNKKDFLAPTPTLQMLIDAGAVQGSVNLAAAIRNTETMPPANFALKLGEHGPFPLRNLTHNQIAEYLKIPQNYYDRMRTNAPELLVDNVQTWLHKPAFAGTRMIRTLDGQARAFLSDRYRPLDNVDLFKAIMEPIIQAEAKIDSCELTETRLYVKCTSHKIQIQAKVGDIIEAGILVMNSEVGMGRLQVGPYLKRLVCMNGATIDDFAVKRVHLGKRSGRRGNDISGDVAVGGGTGGGIPEEWLRDETKIADDKAFFMKVQDTVRASFDREKFEEIAKKITESTGRTMDANPVNVVKAIQNDFLLSDDEEGKVLQNLIKGADLSQWGLANAVTLLAGQVSDYERSTELERAGGQVIQLADNDWEDLLKESKKLAA